MKYFFTCLIIMVSLLCRAQSPSSVFVHFAFDKYDLTTDTRATLDSLTDSLDVSDRIELHGHCDAKGSDEYNIRLSAKRVQAVRDYLLSIGWDKKDMKIVQAHGENMPLNNNESDEDRSLNRRVEIKIMRGQALTLKQKLADTTLKSGTNITLPNIHFVGGRHQFLEISAPALQELLDAMKTFPKLVIRVEGHICCEDGPADGTDEETGLDNLSVARAKAVMDYLIQNGIAKERISHKGFGHSKPIHPYPEQTQEEMTANRRVEIKIISK